MEATLCIYGLFPHACACQKLLLAHLQAPPQAAWWHPPSPVHSPSGSWATLPPSHHCSASPHLYQQDLWSPLVLVTCHHSSEHGCQPHGCFLARLVPQHLCPPQKPKADVSVCTAHRAVCPGCLLGTEDCGFPADINKPILTEMPWLDPGALPLSPVPDSAVWPGHEPKHRGKVQGCAASCSHQGRRANSKATCTEVS